MIMIRNVVLAYTLEITHQLINNMNLLQNLISFLNPDRLFFYRLTILSLEIMDAMFEKESQLQARDIYLAVEQLGGVDFIEDLQTVDQLYDLSSNIVVKYGMGEGVAYVVPFQNNAQSMQSNDQ